MTIKWQTGAGEYQRRVVNELASKAGKGVQLYAAYDSVEGIAYDDMTENAINSDYSIKFIDIHGKSIVDIIQIYSIDTFFVACAQYWGSHLEIAELSCNIVCVVHDLGYEELYYNQLGYYFKFIKPKYQYEDRPGKSWMIYFRLKDSTPRLAKWLFNVRKKRVFEKGLDTIKPTLALLRNNPNAKIVTVSEYTRSALLFYYNVNPQRVRVLYSPERIVKPQKTVVENDELRELIETRKQFYLMISANRNTKNPDKAVDAFQRYSEINKNVHFVVVDFPEKRFDRMHNVSHLCESDLALAYKYCYALVYPSFFEGFGAPPIEAMRYGKPVLSSNTTSLPEILGDAAIFFSPLFSSEIFTALTKLTTANYAAYCEKSKKRYQFIHQLQEQHLNDLCKLILNP